MSCGCVRTGASLFPRGVKGRPPQRPFVGLSGVSTNWKGGREGKAPARNRPEVTERNAHGRQRAPIRSYLTRPRG
ncbi:hypothetical protein JTE90_003173 [Oedothorax gibbosus]|uniref:Uncharacterized protein n=1 Tax=Oedothorax gibbosus TaxID=931172 RepID=A0AAV6UNR5_9ARAC|nr:hypothetical protein JTE90_003173 [Oedothorax gibbosus]